MSERISMDTDSSYRKSAYFKVFLMLEMTLRLLRDLNKQLPESVKRIFDKRTKKIRKKATKLDRKSKAQLEKLATYVIDNYEKSILENEKAEIEFPQDVSPKIEKLFLDGMHTLLFSVVYNAFIRDMSLVYLIAEFESFLRKVLEITFEKRPETLSTSQKNITLKELMKFKDINDAKQQIIQKEILSIINQDIEDINRYFERKFNVELSQFINWKKFQERFYRRNILIHNSGWTNGLYRLKTGYKGKDKRMTVSQDYLKESIELFEDIYRKISEHFYIKFK